MKYNLKNYAFLFLILLLISCKQNNNLNDEKDYVLARTDSSDHVITNKILVNKYDTSRRLIILYSYGDGKISGKGFFKGKLFDGPNIDFYFNGNVLDSVFYKNGIKDGLQKYFYPNGKIQKTEFYIDGKLRKVENFDSLGIKIQ